MANLAGLRGKFWSAFLVLLLATSVVSAQDDITVFTSAHQEAPAWASPNSLDIELTMLPGGPSSIKSTVIPLTASVGLNGTGTIRGV